MKDTLHHEFSAQAFHASSIAKERLLINVLIVAAFTIFILLELCCITYWLRYLFF